MRNLILCMAMMSMTVAASAQSGAASSEAIGIWDWVFENPEGGTMTGTMDVSETDDTYKCVMTGPEGEIEVQELVMEENKMESGHIMYNGMKIGFKGTFAGDNFMGSLIVDYNEFPFHATRQEE